MAQKLIYTDGVKHADLWGDDPTVWTFLSGAPQTLTDEYYSRVAAAFRAFNLKANTVGNMPFALYSKGGEEFDNSATWENKVKFLPNPSELLRLDTLSYMTSNAIYNLRNSDVLGYKQRSMVHAVSSTFTPETDPVTGELVRIIRQVGAEQEYYTPNDKRLFRAWRLDHTTEVLPSPNTEARAIMSAAGVVYYSDFWVQNFYRRGGIKPTLIAMKGLVSTEKREEMESAWSSFLRGIGKFTHRIARIFNAESMEIQPFGSGVDDMKDNKIYEQALANIAMGTGMPLSLLMANSANYATAREEKATWMDNDIIPLCNWLAYEYNRQVFEPLGLRLEFHPETMDTQTEDERRKTDSFVAFGAAFSVYPTFDTFIEAARGVYGMEMDDAFIDAAEAYYKEKEERAKEAQERVQGVGYEIGPDGKPVPAQTPPDISGGSVDVEPDKDDEEEDEKEKDSAKSAVKANDTSAMIALRIPDPIREEIQSKYSFVDKETLDDLHITLVYLGDNRTIDKLDVVRAVSDLGMFQSPIKGKLQGLARFANGQDVDPLVMTFDSHQMPGLYNMLCSVLDNYHVPYHKDHGFIPHMTLAYIPADADMPIDSIEPIEINFGEVYYVDGNVWYPVDLVGYENKTAVRWIPSVDELEEMRIWREVALRRLKKGEPLDFDYQPHHGGLPAAVTEQVKTALVAATTPEQVKAAFVVDAPAPAAEPKPADDIKALADGLNRMADALFGQRPDVEPEKG